MEPGELGEIAASVAQDKCRPVGFWAISICAGHYLHYLLFDNPRLHLSRASQSRPDTIQGIVENRAIGYDDGRPHSALRGLSAREYVENTPKTLTAVGLQDGVRSGRHNGGVGRH